MTCLSQKVSKKMLQQVFQGLIQQPEAREKVPRHVHVRTRVQGFILKARWPGKEASMRAWVSAGIPIVVTIRIAGRSVTTE